MEIEFVGHASVILRRDPIHMICDPWLTGTAFDDGWALLSEPVFKPEDFASITHLWFSHEHPDHFSPRSLAMIAGKTIGMAELQQAADRFSERVKDGRSPTRLKLSAMKMNLAHQRRTHPGTPLYHRLAAIRELMMFRIRPARIWLTDMGTSVDYCLVRGLERTGRKRDTCDIELSSGALFFAFKFLWGGETLQINGRFREIYPEGRVPLFEYLGCACAMNHESGAMARPL